MIQRNIVDPGTFRLRWMADGVTKVLVSMKHLDLRRYIIWCLCVCVSLCPLFRSVTPVKQCTYRICESFRFFVNIVLYSLLATAQYLEEIFHKHSPSRSATVVACQRDTNDFVKKRLPSPPLLPLLPSLLP